MIIAQKSLVLTQQNNFLSVATPGFFCRLWWRPHILNIIKMKHLKRIQSIIILSIAVIFSACSSDDDFNVQSDNLDDFKLAQTVNENGHIIELYTENGNFLTGYNAIYLQIKSAGNLVSDAQPRWEPVMNMMDMLHSCPYSSLTPKENSTGIYKGYILFQMANHGMEHWEINIEYTVDGTIYSANTPIEVEESSHRNIESFQGNDGKNYVLALVEPTDPFVGVNKMKAAVYQMENMMSFVPVDNYKVMIDPRMPGMGNHGSPNNTDLLPIANGIYEGNLSLSMTGYWKINLQLSDASTNIVKGEEVTADNESSSIFFELEF